ncbi:hypothetical protein GGR58DRAFT_521066 [Xylaria digitata]|nr:hypothetical protein GGR58DRAFT_521066 [Xylaria digitata]
MNFAELPDNTPESPWAVRLEKPGETRNVFIWDNLRHSGYAPEAPRVNDPIRYLDTSDMVHQNEAPDVPNDKDLDKLFRIECYQAHKLRGMKTWEAISLHRWVNFGPEFGSFSGGHLPNDTGDTARAMAIVYELSRVQVDETRWFSFFRKDRWYDWIQTSPPARVGGQVWSVDNPNVWKELSVGLELADRALKALIEDKNDHEKWEDIVPPTAGAEYSQPPIDNARVLLGLRTEKIIAEEKGQPCPFNWIADMSKPQWRQRLEEILSTYRWIVHELTHGIIGSRFQNNLPGEYPPNRTRPPEPFINFHGINEIGHTMEHLFFGGSTMVLPLGSDVPIAVISYDIPNPLYTHYPFIDGDWNKEGANILSTYTPASWTSKLLSEAFWNDENTPQKSADYFHRPFIFRNSTPWAVDFSRWGYVCPDLDDDTLATLVDEHSKVLETWNERHELLDNVRGSWYDDEVFKWYWIEWRVKIDRFAAAFARRDEVACGRIAIDLVYRVNWSEDRKTYEKYLPEDSRDLSPWWIFHCIGLLMMASIPIRHHRLVHNRATNQTNWTYSAVPSREAAASGAKYAIRLGFDGKKEEGNSVAGSTFFNQVRQTGQKVNDIEQFDYIGLVSDVVQDVVRYAPIYSAWVTNILEAQAKIHEERVVLQNDYREAHVTRWASRWLFEIPEYNQQVVRIVDNVRYEMRWNQDTQELEFAVI